MLRRLITTVLMALLLAACTQSGGSDKAEPSKSPTGPPAATDPVIAFTLPSNDVIDTSRILAKSKSLDVGGIVHDFLPSGSVLVDRHLGGDLDKPAFPVLVDPTTGHETAGKKSYNADNGLIGLGKDSLLVTTDDGKKQRLQEFGLDFKKIREIALPGKSGSGLPGDGLYTVYGDAVEGDGAVFLTESKWRNVESVSDSVVRVDGDGNLTTLLKGKHVNHLSRASDGHSILAAMGTEAHYYEGGPPLADIAELDARSGKILKSFGTPPTCAKFKAVLDDASCLDRLDKVGDAVAATVYESKKGSDDFKAYSTWRYKDGAWNEVKSQRNKRVVWQSHTTRLQQQVELSFANEPKPYPLEWVVDGKASKLAHAPQLTAFDWSAPGSLIRP